VVSTTDDPQAAPDGLEPVRALINTWRIPNDTRHPADELDGLAAALGVPAGDRGELRALRDDLRAVVEQPADADVTLTAWVERLGVRMAVTDGTVRFRHRRGALGDLVVAVLDAMVEGTWARLKACPDCRWAFYDRTRNGSKRWCLMESAGPGSRGCGNIAKVRRHRARTRDGGAAG
jgi:predicted RNA-binding Zn ribbon-like protein